MCNALPSEAAVRIDTILIKLKYYYYYSMDFLSFLLLARLISFISSVTSKGKWTVFAMLNHLIYFYLYREMEREIVKSSFISSKIHRKILNRFITASIWRLFVLYEFYFIFIVFFHSIYMILQYTVCITLLRDAKQRMDLPERKIC